MKTFNIGGKILSVTELGQKTDIQRATVHYRTKIILQRNPGITDDEMLPLLIAFKPEGRKPKKVRGKTAEEWAEIYDMTATQMRGRWRKWGVDDPKSWETKEEAQARRLAEVKAQNRGPWRPKRKKLTGHYKRYRPEMGRVLAGENFQRLYL